MPITVIVRAVPPASGEVARLTFDGTQRVVIGRGAGSDVRLPEPSVSHRHASLRAQGAEFALIDEGSTNGTYVGDVRIAARTSRIVRSGDLVRVGRLWLELRIDLTPATRDVSAATRDLALALVSQMMAAVGTDPTPRVRVVEGRDQGALVPLTEEGHVYVVGRSPHCDLELTDPDASREHVHVVLRSGAAFLRDCAAKNGTFLGESRVAAGDEVHWRPTTMARIGRTVLALEEPIAQALADLERAADEPLEARPAPPAPGPVPEAGARDAASPAANDVPASSVSSRPPAPSAPPPRTATQPAVRWTLPDKLVMAAALCVLALSLAGLVWLLRG
jgi:pSer/pThr/pTyr-binding forkhead associated (FHA) protein